MNLSRPPERRIHPDRLLDVTRRRSMIAQATYLGALYLQRHPLAGMAGIEVRFDEYLGGWALNVFYAEGNVMAQIKLGNDLQEAVDWLRAEVENPQ